MAKVVFLLLAFAIVLCSFAFSNTVALMQGEIELQPLALTANVDGVCKEQLAALDSCDTSGQDCSQKNADVQACTMFATQLAEQATAICRAVLDKLQECNTKGADLCMFEDKAVKNCAQLATEQIAADRVKQEQLGG